jgi:hypothetical protein
VFTRKLIPSPAMVVALVALIAASAGGATAATLISGKQIRNSSITSADIKNRSLRQVDLNKGVLTAVQSTAREVTRANGPAGVAPAATWTPIASIVGLEPGAYVVMAKANLRSDQLDASRCRLELGAASDESSRGLRANGTAEAHNLELTAFLTGSGTATLSCRTSAGHWTASDANIIALRISGTTVTNG